MRLTGEWQAQVLSDFPLPLSRHHPRGIAYVKKLQTTSRGIHYNCAVESQVVALIHEYMDRLNFEMQRKRILGFGMRSTIEEHGKPPQNVIWWFRAKYLLEDKVVDDLTLYAAVNGLSLTKLSDSDDDNLVAYEVRYTGAPFVLPPAEEIAALFLSEAPQTGEAKSGGSKPNDPNQTVATPDRPARQSTAPAAVPSLVAPCPEVTADGAVAKGKPKKSKCSPAEWQAYRKRVLAGEDEASDIMSLELVAVKVDLSERTILRMLEDPSSKLKRFGGNPIVGKSSNRKSPGSGRVLITRKSYNECFDPTGI